MTVAMQADRLNAILLPWQERYVAAPGEREAGAFDFLPETFLKIRRFS